MKIIYTSGRVFELRDPEDRILGTLDYHKWSSTKAAITTQYAEFFELCERGFWTSHIEVATTDKIIAQLKSNWRGRIIIDFSDTEAELDYQFKPVGFWSEHYIVEDRQKNCLFTLMPDFNWGKFNYDYNVEINPDFQSSVSELLILLSVYCANYLRRKRSAQAAAS